MKYYHVTVQANDTAPLPDETNSAFLRMEMLFTVGDNALYVPVGASEDRPEQVTVGEIVKGVIGNLGLTGLMRIMKVNEITREAASRYAKHAA